MNESNSGIEAPSPQPPAVKRKRKKAGEQGELIAREKEFTWIVTTSEDGEFHTLRFDRKKQMTAKHAHGLKRLREMADFCNKAKLAPRAKVQCAADAASPETYLESNRP